MKSVTRLEKLLLEFVAQEERAMRIERLFAFAKTRVRERCGFENWLKFELVMHALEKGIEVDIEKKIDVDNRKAQSKLFHQTDLVLSFNSELTFGVELKVRSDESRAIRALKADLKKHSKATPSSRYTANFAVVLCGVDIDPKTHEKLKNDLHNFRVIPAGNGINFLVAEDK